MLMVGETYVMAGISKINKHTLPLGEFDGTYILVGQRFTCARLSQVKSVG
jgi:hypothetical protein